MESNILLESGTNELEVLEFMVGEQSFGINIAKVTEIMNYQPMVPVPDSHPAFAAITCHQNIKKWRQAMFYQCA